jgi:hypothetical protein
MSRTSEPPVRKRPKYVSWTVADKVWLLDHSKNNPSLSYEDLGKALALQFNSKVTDDRDRREPVKKNTVAGWKKEEEQLRKLNDDRTAKGIEATVRDTQQQNPRMEEALYIWFRQMQARDLAITDEVLKEKAKKFGEELGVKEGFGYSAGWLQRFKKRYGIKSYVLHEEAGDANQEGIELAQRNLRLLLGGYSAEVTYNQDETGIFWRQQPTRTLAVGKKAGLKKEKERVTASLMCNAAGTDKRPLFLIGKALRPRSFPKSFQPKRDLGIRYTCNKSAWMTTNAYSSYVKVHSCS